MISDIFRSLFILQTFVFLSFRWVILVEFKYILKLGVILFFSDYVGAYSMSIKPGTIKQLICKTLLVSCV